jgi:GT2 family glycosyltransferase
VKPRVTAIVPSWNRRPKVLKCVGSLVESDYGEIEVVVVDNASEDGSVAAIRSHYPDVVILENETNLGFTGAVNRGLRHAADSGSIYAFLLNDDAYAARDAVTLLVEAAGETAVGVVGPCVLFADRPDVLWSAGGCIDPLRGRTSMVGCGEVDRGQYGASPREVDFVTGCAMLIRLDILPLTGLLEERFFAYYEEVEWCARVRRRNFRIVHEPRARVWHDIDVEKQAHSADHLYYMTRNRLLYLNLVGAPWWLGLRVVLLEDLRTVLSWTLRRHWKPMRDQRRVVVRAVADYYRGRFGAAPRLM